MSLKITREVRSELQKIAGKLPRDFSIKKGLYPWSGADLKLTGITKDPTTGGPLDPEKIYGVSGPVFVEKDHLSNLEDAFKHGGVRAVNEYVDALATKEIILVKVPH